MTTANPPTYSAQSPTPPAPRKKRRWLKILLSLLILILLLILLTPTLLSTAPGRNFILSRINSYIPGKIQAETLSLGWFSGASAKGFQLLDPDGHTVLSVSEVNSGVTLLHALTASQYDLGDVKVVINGHIESYPDGSNNLRRALIAPLAERHSPMLPGATPQPSAPAQPVVIKGNFDILIQQLTFNSPHAPTMTINSTIKGRLDADTLKADLKATLQSGQSKPSAITGNVDVTGLRTSPGGKGSAKIADLDLAALTPLLNTLGIQLTTTGTLNSELSFAGGGSPTKCELHGNTTITQLALAGPALRGDTLRSATVSIPVDIAVDQHLITIKNARLETDFATVSIQGTTTLTAIRTIAHESPTAPADSDLTLSGNADLKALADQLPHLLALKQDVHMTSGNAALSGYLRVTKGARETDLEILVKDIAGTAGSRDLRLDPLSIKLLAARVGDKVQPVVTLLMPADGATLKLSAQPDPAHADLVAIQGTFSLDQLIAQLSQFVELGAYRFAGRGTLSGTLGTDLSTALPLDLTLKIEGFQTLNSAAPSQIPPTTVSALIAGQLDLPAHSLIFTGESYLEERDPQSKAGNRITFPQGSSLPLGPGNLNLTAALDYDLARINTLASPWLPANTILAGQRSVKLHITGPLTTDPGIKQLQKLQIDPTALGWDRVKISGVDLGKADLPLSMKDGVIPISPTDIPANGGTVRLQGKIDFNEPTPAFILTKAQAPYTIVRNLNLDQEIASGPLRYLPMTWGASGKDLNLINISGRVSLDLTDAYLPLSYDALKARGIMHATINIDPLRTDAPMFKQLSDLTGGLTKLLGGGGGSSSLMQGQIRDIAITLQDGKVHYENFRLGSSWGNLTFSGDVGLDQTLAMNIDLATRGVSVPIPIALAGTTSKPIPTISGKFTKDLGKNLQNLGGGVQDLGKGLGDLFKKK